MKGLWRVRGAALVFLAAAGVACSSSTDNCPQLDPGSLGDNAAEVAGEVGGDVAGEAVAEVAPEVLADETTPDGVADETTPDVVEDAETSTDVAGEEAATKPGEIPVEQAGAVCDGVHDDSAAIQQANHLAFEAGAVVRYPLGKTCVARGVVVLVDQVGAECASPADAACLASRPVLKVPDADATCTDPTADCNKNRWIFDLGTGHVLIRGLAFDGNRAHQPAPSYCESHDGQARNSLVKAQRLFQVAEIDGCLFHDTQYGAIAFGRPEVDADPATEPADLATIETLTIRDSEFRDIGTDGVRVQNAYGKATLAADQLTLQGTFVFNRNVATRVGTVLATPSACNLQTDQGHGLVVEGLYSVEITANSFTDTARTDVSIGAANHVIVSGNQSKDPMAGAVELLSTALPPVKAAHPALAPVLPGVVSIEANHFETRHAGSSFVTLSGSKCKDQACATPKAAVFPTIAIRGNTVVHTDFVTRDCCTLPDPPATGPCTCKQTNEGIALVERAKVAELVVQGNTFTHVRRSAVQVALPVVDGYRMERLAILGNDVGGPWQSAETCNSLLCADVDTGGKPIRNVEVSSNAVVGTFLGVYAGIDLAEHLSLLDNCFAQIAHSDFAATFCTAGTSTTALASLKSATVMDNHFDGVLMCLPGTGVLWDGNGCDKPLDCGKDVTPFDCAAASSGTP